MLTNRLRSIKDWHRFLSLELDPEGSQFDREGFLIKGFNKAGT